MSMFFCEEVMPLVFSSQRRGRALSLVSRPACTRTRSAPPWPPPPTRWPPRRPPTCPGRTRRGAREWREGGRGRGDGDASTPHERKNDAPTRCVCLSFARSLTRHATLSLLLPQIRRQWRVRETGGMETIAAPPSPVSTPAPLPLVRRSRFQWPSRPLNPSQPPQHRRRRRRPRLLHRRRLHPPVDGLLHPNSGGDQAVPAVS